MRSMNNESRSDNPLIPPGSGDDPSSPHSQGRSRPQSHDGANPLVPPSQPEAFGSPASSASHLSADAAPENRGASGSFSESLSSNGNSAARENAEKVQSLFNPLQGIGSAGLDKEKHKNGEEEEQEEEEDKNLDDSDFLDVDSSSYSIPAVKPPPDKNPLAPRDGPQQPITTANHHPNTDAGNPLVHGHSQQSEEVSEIASREPTAAMQNVTARSSITRDAEALNTRPKQLREPEFTAEEIVKDRRLSIALGKVHNVFFKWKIFFLLVLVACAIISLVGLILTIVELLKDIRLKVIREVAIYSAMCMINSISSCASSLITSPGQSVSEPTVAASLRKAVRKSNWKKTELMNYIESGKKYLEQQNCDAAAEVYNDLFLAATERSNELLNTAGQTEIADFTRGWALGWTQLRAEGILKFTEDTPITSARAIRGVSYNVMCLNTIRSASMAPEMADVLECSADYNNILTAAPVLAVSYALRMDTMLDLAMDLSLDTGIPNPLMNDLFHIIAYSLVLLFSLLSMLYLVRAPFQNIQMMKEEGIVKRDFHTSSSHVEMRRSTLRLLDYYVWHLGVFQSVNAREARQIGFELTEEDIAREEAEAAELNHQLSVGGDTHSGPQTEEPSEGGRENSSGKLVKCTTVESLADPLGRFSSENDDLHTYRGRTIPQQAAERAQLIATYVENSIALKDTAQIQLLIHKIASSLLLLRPFIPRHTLKPCDLDRYEIKDLGPSVTMRHSQLVLQEGLETDTSTYLFISFYPFNRPEAVSTAKEFHGAKEDLAKKLFVEDEAQRQAKHCCLFRESNLEKLYEAQKKDDDLLTTAHDKETKKRESERLIVRDDNEDNEDGSGAGDVRRTVSGDATRSEFSAVGGRLTDAERIARYVEQRKMMEMDAENGGPMPGEVPNALAPPPELHGDSHSPHSLSQNGNHGRPSSSDGTGSENPLLGADRGGLSHKFVSQYALSSLAAGVNYVVESIFRAAGVYHGDVVQVCGDGVLVKFSNSPKDRENKLGAKHTREEDMSFPVSEEADSPDNEEDGLMDITICAQLHHLSAAERAVRTAIGLQEAMRKYLDCSADMYISPELLQCPMAIVSENFSFKGRLRYHVTKHYAVLSRCIPLIFALERINIEYGAEILMTEPVKSQVESFVLSRPIHYLQVEDLNYHYIKATKTNTRNETSGANQNASPDGSDEEEDLTSPTSPRRSDPNSPQPSDPGSPNASPRAGSRRSNPEERSRFAAKGTIFELFNVMPLSTADIHFRSYVDDESHNRVRREHWRLIWEKYITIVSVEPQINLLRKFVNTADNGSTNNNNNNTATNLEGTVGNAGDPKTSTTEDANFEGSRTSANNYHHSNSLENSFANNSTSRMDNRGQSIASSINSMRDRLHDFMKELHTYNHIYEFSSREQYSCQKLWKYGHDLLITLGVTEEELDNEYG